jgi:hypothetical protein
VYSGVGAGVYTGAGVYSGVGAGVYTGAGVYSGVGTGVSGGYVVVSPGVMYCCALNKFAGTASATVAAKASMPSNTSARCSMIAVVVAGETM